MGRGSGQYLPGAGRRGRSPAGRWPQYPCGGARWGPAGFQDYLGERYDPEAGRWEELYGRRAKLTFGLDLYAPERAQGDQALQTAFDALAGALHREGPPGMRLLELSCGETEYDQGGAAAEAARWRRYVRRASTPRRSRAALFQDFEMQRRIGSHERDHT